MSLVAQQLRFRCAGCCPAKICWRWSQFAHSQPAELTLNAVQIVLYNTTSLKAVRVNCTKLPVSMQYNLCCTTLPASRQYKLFCTKLPVSMQYQLYCTTLQLPGCHARILCNMHGPMPSLAVSVQVGRADGSVGKVDMCQR